MSRQVTLDTVWEVDDELWSVIEPILLQFWPRKSTGRRPADWRRCLNGIIFQLRSGCQWNSLPKQFGDDSTVHRWFQRWTEEGVLLQIWAILVEHCDDLRGVEWKWQAADGSLAKARFGGPTWGPTHGSSQKRDEDESPRRRPGRPARGDDRSGQLA